MTLQEIANLIAIRQYICNTIDNPGFKRETVYKLQTILEDLDKKIVENLSSLEFNNLIR